MYLLIACTASWLSLVGAFAATLICLPSPRTTTELVIIIAVGVAALAFSRLGIVSLLSLSLRLLPDGHIRATLAALLIRIVPAILRSTVIAAASASLAVQAANASPLPDEQFLVPEHSAAADHPAEDAGPVLDPGWPTSTPDDEPPDRPEALDPGWPSTPPADEPAHNPPPNDTPSAEQPSDHSSDEPTNSPTDDPTAKSPNAKVPEPEPTQPEPEIHTVGEGESLWSIAASLSDTGSRTQDLIEDIYAANRNVIGSNPNLIMPGQRLEIQP